MPNLKSYQSIDFPIYLLLSLFCLISFNACNSCQRGMPEDDSFDKKDVSAYSGTITRKSSGEDDFDACPMVLQCGTNVSVLPVISDPFASVTTLNITVCNEEASESVFLCVSAKLNGITQAATGGGVTIAAKSSNTFTVVYSTSFTPTGTGEIYLKQNCSDCSTSCDTDTISVTFCE